MREPGSKYSGKPWDARAPNSGASIGFPLFAWAFTMWEDIPSQPLGWPVILLLRQQPFGTRLRNRLAAKATSMPIFAMDVAVLPSHKTRAKPFGGGSGFPTLKAGASEAVPKIASSHGSASNLFRFAAMWAS